MVQFGNWHTVEVQPASTGDCPKNFASYATLTTINFSFILNNLIFYIVLFILFII